MQIDLNGRVAIITGGAGAIGSAMALQFAKNGAKVVIADLSEDAMQRAIDQAASVGIAISAIEVDVSDKNSAANMVNETVARFGKVDILVNNAGINGAPNERVPMHEYSDALWERIIQVDLNGVYYCSKAAVNQMIRQGTGGNIINIASVVGVTPLRLQCAFAAAKAGVIHLSKAMALELAEHNIRVNAIAPGSIMFEGTRQLLYSDPARAESMLSHIPQKRPGEPDDIAAMTCYLASDDANYMTGSIQIVDGGWTCGYMRDF